MIKYRDIPHPEWLAEREREWYKDGVSLNYYAAANLRVYMQWMLELYRKKFGDGSIRFLEPGCRMGEAGAGLASLHLKDVYYKGMELSSFLVGESKRYHTNSFQGDICCCPEIKSASFEIVFSRTLFGFLRDIPSAVKEMIRIASKMVIIIQPTPVILGVHHYASMDSIEDIAEVIGGWKHEVFHSIPIYDGSGKSIFNELILVLEK